VGDTVNCGSRLCSLAGPGEIVVSEDTFDGHIPGDAIAIGKVNLKGVDRDLRPYRITPGT
jgi:class 3 adenylate cyclase